MESKDEDSLRSRWPPRYWSAAKGTDPPGTRDHHGCLPNIGPGLALDLRDRETEGHTQRFTKMTVKLSIAPGISETKLVHVRRGALLHDMGKIGVPDAILLKPGPLIRSGKSCDVIPAWLMICSLRWIICGLLWDDVFSRVRDGLIHKGYCYENRSIVPGSNRCGQHGFRVSGPSGVFYLMEAVRSITVARYF